MNDKVKKENRRALPKFFLVIVLAGIFGGMLGFGAGVAGRSGAAEAAAAWLEQFWRTVTPWAIPVSSAVLLGGGWRQYRAAGRLFAAWDGEDETAIDAADEKLNWALLLTALTLILDFFFMAASQVYRMRASLAVVGCFILSMAAVTILQQKTVDLTKRMNPEKRGSVYDMKFQKKWMESCDEAEQRQIGQAAYRAYSVTTQACIGIWLALVVLSFVFDLGILPVFVVTLVWGIQQVSYILACIRLGKR